MYDVVFVCTLFIDQSGKPFSGGAEIHLRNIIESLSEVPKEKKLIIQAAVGSTGATATAWEGIGVISVGCRNLFDFKRRLPRVLASAPSRQVHFNYLGLERFVKKSPGVRYTATFHGTGWDFPVTTFPDGYIAPTLAVRLGTWLTKKLMIREQVRAIKKLDGIISVDNSLLLFTQQFLTENRNKINVIYNFVDTEKFGAKQETERGSGKTVILYPRNISYARGVHLLAPLAEELRNRGLDFVINLVGASIGQIGGNKYQRRLEEEIRQKSLSDCFNFLGRVDHQEMPAKFLEADIVVIPTYFSEGTSLSCLEAMASGKVVVATNIGGLNDIIRDGFNGYLSQPTAPALAEKIETAARLSSKERSKITENASALLRQVFAFGRWREEIRSFFKL